MVVYFMCSFGFDFIDHTCNSFQNQPIDQKQKKVGAKNSRTNDRDQRRKIIHQQNK
jgi:hypothetical protein